MSGNYDTVDMYYGIDLRYKEFQLKVDKYEGINSIGQSIVTITYYPNSLFNTYIGTSVPNNKSGNLMYLFIGFNIIF